MDKRSTLLVRHADPAVLRSQGVPKEMFERLYAGGAAWEIGKPQPEVVKIENAGGFRGSVLDIGCGPGENAIFLAQKGYAVHAIDFLSSVIERVRDRYRAECESLRIVFEVADALSLDRLGKTFDCVLDAGMFHGLSDQHRLAYEQSLRAISVPGTTLHMICFSKEETRPGGPRRIGVDEVRASLGASWDIRSTRQAEYNAMIFDTPAPAKAWAIELVRRAG
ncbi:MAG TPA: class I SAM-dependent methyltransferase [Stellaceae bacterium]|nr:class I SAM-dependent methyltransferase [Stellaceae bacterium]